MCDSGDRRRACIFVHLDNLDIIVTATKPPFSWTKALRLYYTHIVPRSERSSAIRAGCSAGAARRPPRFGLRVAPLSGAPGRDLGTATHRHTAMPMR